MDEKLPPPGAHEQMERLETECVTRRTFLMNVGIALNAAVALLIATPVVSYLLGPVLRRKEYLQWIAIGNVNDFSVGETKLISFQNPFSDPWDGETAKVPAYVRRSAPERVHCIWINCAHLGCPVRWFSECSFLCVRVTAACTTQTGSRASGPPERGLFTYELKVQGGKLLINAGQMPTLRNRASASPRPSPASPNVPKLVSRIESCPGSKSRGTNASTIG